MDKNAIKKYAVWARRELIFRVSQRAALYEITDKGYGDASADSVLGRVMSAEEKRQRQALIAQIREKGYEQVMEEIAYTWFNRFIALRFMEVNGYLPSHVRVFTDDDNTFRPQILSEAINMELDGLDMEKVYALKNTNDDDALFKYMIIVQCNALSSILPGMFQHISDFTELLFPDNLLREGSVIEQMVSMIPEEDWTDQVQIIGWLYQYYNLDLFNEIYDGDNSKKKIEKNQIPSATQLFTPDWVVHYMVENSLGRLWLEGHPNDDLKVEWKYYLDEAEQEPEVQAQLATIRKEYAALKPEEIRVIDPCMGSGHILCVFFDVLVRIYEDYGYTAREAAVKIVENNLWGLDIDDRAAQLSYFAVMMKARQYDRRFLTRKVQPHVYAIEESNGMTSAPMHDMGLNLSQEEYGIAVKQTMRLVEEMHDAKEYGSIIQVTPCDWDLLRRFAIPRDEDGQLHLDIHGEIETSARLQVLINIGEALAQKYHAVVTNPPYLGNSRMNANLASFIRDQYPDEKSDLATVMLNRIVWGFTKTNYYASAITTVSWMFLTSFDKFRKKMVETSGFISIVDFGTELFEGKLGHLPVAAWVTRNNNVNQKIPTIRLVDYCYSRRDEKENEFFNVRNKYEVNQTDFLLIPGMPIAYWIGSGVLNAFRHNPVIGDYSRPRIGQNTGDNNRFLRLWHEVAYPKITFGLKHNSLMTEEYKWIPYNKGGSFRRWYGNQEYVVNWENDGREIKEYAVVRNHGKHWSRYIQNIENLCKPGLTWSFISATTTSFSVRYMPEGFICDVAGSAMFPEGEMVYPLLSLCNSNFATEVLRILNPTINMQASNVANIPVSKGIFSNEEIVELTKECIELTKSDWDSFETSWDFFYHPLLPVYADDVDYAYSLEAFYHAWEDRCQQRFNKLKENEEKLNKILIEIYGLQDELTPEVEDNNVSIRKADLQRDIKSLISFAVGCMFGRYNLWHAGLAYAGGELEMPLYDRFPADKDGIVPICDDEYFKDDIVGRFIDFIRIAYGEKLLEENLRFIAYALGGKGAPREVIRSYFINDFYADHLKVYQKRPIYWLFDSGKKNGFKCLIYMHRYQPDTIARIRTDYVHEQQSRYRTAIADLEQRINGASTSERVKLSKQLATLQGQTEEIRIYEEKIHHLADQMIRIDLDDGVKHNYAIFQDVLAKIK